MFYFVHSFHLRLPRPGRRGRHLRSTAGRFTAVDRAGNIVATQFHPEKSQDNGLQMLTKFARWNP